MNVTKENASANVLHLKLDVEQADYAENVLKILKDHQRKAHMPGFRPGKVPFGLVKKMYEKSVIADEINRLLSDTVNKYVEENKLNLIGNPIPLTEKNEALDFDDPKDFSFWFELGLVPAFEIKTDKIKVPLYEIALPEDMIDKSVESTRERFGKVLNPEAEAKDQQMEKAEMNEEFFKMVYPQDDIKTEKEFRERIRKEGEDMHAKEADRKMLNEAVDLIVENVEIDLPDDFLKRWLKATDNSGELTDELLENDYPRYKKSLKWQLIEQKLLDENNIKVSYEDVRQHYIDNVLTHYFPKSEDEESQKRLEGFADQMLQNKDQARRAYDVVYEEKLIDLFKKILTFQNKKVSFDEFIDILKKERGEETGTAAANEKPAKVTKTKEEPAPENTETSEQEEKPVKKTTRKKAAEKTEDTETEEKPVKKRTTKKKTEE